MNMIMIYKRTGPERYEKLSEYQSAKLKIVRTLDAFLLKNPTFELLGIQETATYEPGYHDEAASVYNELIVKIRRPMTRYEELKYDAQRSRAFKQDYERVKELYVHVFKRECKEELPAFTTRWPKKEGETTADYNKRVINIEKELKAEHDALVKSWGLDTFSLDMVKEGSDVSDD